MKTFKFYNTLTATVEPFTPLKGPDVGLYTCGPTVYNFAHIGNLRTYMFEDILKRSLEFFGYRVKHVMNITDIDDKTLKGALDKGISLKAYTEPYTQAFFEDLATLQMIRADFTPKATDYIGEMIEMVARLIQEGHAYVGPDQSVYFSLASFPSYGKLSHLDKKTLKVGASSRIQQDEYDKENPSDFVLWKAFDPARDGTIFWESPWGKGRPGWHIECSAMASKLLGKTLDIHCGGIDNLFPHHENEMAQCEACFHKPFVKLWLHAQHLMVEGKKMSKSLGNFYTLRDLLAKGYSSRAIRWVLMASHYRMALNFTFEGLEAAKGSLSRLDSFIDRLGALEADEGEILDLSSYEKEFEEGLLNDLNLPLSLAALFELVRFVNQQIDERQLGKKEGQKVLALLKKWDAILGVLFTRKVEIPLQITALAEARIQAKKDKDFKRADALRQEIQEAGYLIEDTPSGYRMTRHE